jgi:hypothetical protein
MHLGRKICGLRRDASRLGTDGTEAASVVRDLPLSFMLLSCDVLSFENLFILKRFFEKVNIVSGT